MNSIPTILSLIENADEYELSRAADLYKEMKAKEPPKSKVQQVVDEAKAICQEGDWVNVFGTPYIGKVVGFNERTGGFYPGDRYPVFVKIIKCLEGNKNGAEECTFEYGLYFIKKLDSMTGLDDDYLFGFTLGRTKWTKDEAIEMFELEHENKASTQFINGWIDANKIYQDDN